MGMRMMGVLVIGLMLFLARPPVFVFAADESTTEAAPATVDEAPVDAAAADAAALDQIRAAIDAETDPELKQAMEEQLKLLESGELNLEELQAEHRVALGAPLSGPQPLPDSTAGGVVGSLPGGLPGGGLVGPPVDIGTNPQGGENMPPEVRAQLEKLFQEKGTGDPAKDGAVREEAERILREYGINSHEVGLDHEGDEGAPSGLERAFEQMSPEGREQLERAYENHEGPEVFREIFEREYSGAEVSSREMESMERAFEGPGSGSETMTHEYEAPTDGYEAPEGQYEPQGYPQP